MTFSCGDKLADDCDVLALEFDMLDLGPLPWAEGGPETPAFYAGSAAFLGQTLAQVMKGVVNSTASDDAWVCEAAVDATS